MLQFIRRLFDSSDFMPHGHCYLWRPEVLWLHVISDGLIALAYFSIPVTLVYLARKRRDLPFPWLFSLFGLFIVACGTTHVLSIVTVWTPIYRLDGIAKAITALASVGTALVLIPMIPMILGLVGPDKLLAANRLLEEEIIWRKKTEARLDAQNDVAQIAAGNVSLQEAAPLFLKSILPGWGVSRGRARKEAPAKPASDRPYCKFPSTLRTMKTTRNRSCGSRA